MKPRESHHAEKHRWVPEATEVKICFLAMSTNFVHKHYVQNHWKTTNRVQQPVGTGLTHYWQYRPYVMVPVSRRLTPCQGTCLFLFCSLSLFPPPGWCSLQAPALGPRTCTCHHTCCHAPALVVTPAADSSGLKQYLRWRTFAILGSLGYRHHPWTRLWLCLDEWDRGAAKERCWTFWRERGAFLTHPLCPCGPWSPGLLSPGTLYIYIHLVFPSL